MIRTTITMDEELTRELDAYIESSGAFNRSEAIRDLVRRGLNSLPVEESNQPCIGVISFTTDQTISGLAKRIRLTRLERHDEFIFTSSIPVNHVNSIDIALMRGPVGRVNEYAQALFLQRGVKHGSIALIPIEPGVQSHSHDDATSGQTHAHIKVQESF
jgi:Predicted transcriptional regulators containing the CopG/Arc/MetJ DNA-binding domain and a metal-binding domain